MIELQLHENWQLCDIKKQDWIPAQVPGDIYSALLKAEKMPDPFFGDNEYQAKALMEEDYEYRTVFTYDEKQFENCQEVILRFDGIDTIADIYLNECYLGKADNMHRVWEFPVGELLQEGENTLRVIIRSPLKFMAEAFKKYKNIGNEDTVEGFMHLRKAHYMSGWDWGACLPDGGIFRPVTLLGIESARLDSVYIRQVHEDGKVLLIPEVDVETVDEAEIDTDEKNSAEMPDQGVESEADEDLLEYEVTVTAPDGTKIVSDGSPDEIVIENPQFWWPNGLGEQPLYQVQVDLKAGDKTVDTWCKKIGLRTLTMHIEKDEWGESFAHEVNGYQVFAMGADYIPEDNLLQVCIHTAKHSYVRAPGMRLHMDVDRIVAHTDIDWELFLKKVKEAHVCTSTYLSLYIPSVILHTQIPQWVLDELRPKNIKRLMKLLSEAGLPHPHEKKFSKIGFLLFQTALYDKKTDLVRVIYPSKVWMHHRYSHRGFSFPRKCIGGRILCDHPFKPSGAFD